MNKIKEKFKKIPLYIWLLLAVILLGIFLRSYHLHDWLDFGSDQVHDAVIVDGVISHGQPWPVLGPDMSHSGSNDKNRRFHIGPMYYYFEIISAKVFGDQPDHLAYPDLLFSILAIPLFYYFLSRYFSNYLSLALTFLYTISYFSLKFSHSAWNPNSIPFFTLLFLLSLWKFLTEKRKVGWIWPLLLGIALGVGVQLHAITMVIFTVVTVIVLVYSLAKNWRLWSKWLVVILIALILNSAQIVNELKTNFSNSRTFLSVSADNNHGLNGWSLVKNIDCHFQANGVMLSALGDKEECDFIPTNLITNNISKSIDLQLKNPFTWVELAFYILFSVFGYVTLIILWLKEKEQAKKIFLGLIFLFIIVSFLVMLPIIDNDYIRYFLHTFFVPLVFMGLLVDFLKKKYAKECLWLVIPIFIIFVATNVKATSEIVQQLVAGNRNSEKALVLGELESMDNYIIVNSQPKNEAYLTTIRIYSNFYRSLQYLAGKKGFNLLLGKNEYNLEPDKPVYLLNMRLDNQNAYGNNQYQNFGQVALGRIR